MNLSDPHLILLLAAICLVAYFVIAIILMVFAMPAVKYRRTKYQDEGVQYRWLLIPFLLPLRLSYSLVLWAAKAVKWLMFLLIGVVALVLSPLYIFIYRPLLNYTRNLNEAMKSFDKFVVFFRFGIRLGLWLMFYQSEPLSADRERPKVISGTSFRRAQLPSKAAARPHRPSPERFP